MPITLGDTVHGGTLLATQLGSGERRATIHATSVSFPDGTSQSSAGGGATYGPTNRLDASFVGDGTVSNAELAYLNGVINPVQQQIDQKVNNLQTQVNAKIEVAAGLGYVAGNVVVRNAANNGWSHAANSSSSSTYAFSPGTGFELCHSVFGGDGLVNLWTHAGMHLNATLSSLSSNSNGTDLEIFFKVTSNGSGTDQIYFTGFNLNKVFDSSAVNQTFTSGSEQYKTTEAGSYQTWPGGTVARPNTSDWRWVFANSTNNYGNSTSLVFDLSNVYGLGAGTGQGSRYSAQVWVKTS